MPVDNTSVPGVTQARETRRYKNCSRTFVEIAKLQPEADTEHTVRWKYIV